jgi:5-formyltetrahydrofolate cyclo-ligase
MPDGVQQGPVVDQAVLQMKQELRTRILGRRSALPVDKRRELSLHIRENIISLDAWRKAASVVLYMPIKNEVDVEPLLHDLWERDVRTFIPRCRPEEQGHMEFAGVSCLEDLRPGKYGIPEPHPLRCEVEEDCRPDVALIPGVAFDLRGNRLGMGAGYYDRRLADPGMAETLLIAPAYAFQLVEEVPAEEWDKAVHIIVSEDEILWT